MEAKLTMVAFVVVQVLAAAAFPRASAQSIVEACEKTPEPKDCVDFLKPSGVTDLSSPDSLKKLRSWTVAKITTAQEFMTNNKKDMKMDTATEQLIKKCSDILQSSADTFNNAKDSELDSVYPNIQKCSSKINESGIKDHILLDFAKKVEEAATAAQVVATIT